MSEFHLFGSAVRRQFEVMAADTLFEVDAEGLWEAYLESFPAGSNPMFRQRTEHDCSCCRHFIRSTGNVVAIQNGAVTSIWDVQGLPPHYQAVADRMSAFVKGRAIKDVFLTRFPQHGTFDSTEFDGETLHTWTHFAVSIPRKHQHPNPAEAVGKLRTNQQTLLRGVTELKESAVAEVIDLIESDALYRGAEHLAAVKAFAIFQTRFLNADVDDPDLCWSECHNNQLAHFRNSVIGTLIQDLSAGVDLETAVRSFESKVAPHNYRRSSALITPRMIEQALSTLDSLGLREAVQRRHARLSDVSVNSVLFVDRAVRPLMKDSLSALLIPEATGRTAKVVEGQTITIKDFLEQVLPETTAIDLFLEPRLSGNLMSLTAPAAPDTGRLFQWPNDFAWSYSGNVTDSIKEKVKRAGGMVEGVDMRVSLAWGNYDDLDLHCHAPLQHIYFGNKAGILDVDMNVVNPVRDPVENMRWIKPRDGTYGFFVHCYTKREALAPGFEIEIEGANGITSLRYDKPLRHGDRVEVARITCRGGQIVNIDMPEGIIAGQRSSELWGLRAPEFHRVNSIILSPNHWNEPGTGNKHWFFLLEGAKNPEATRGFYNEFLAGALVPHRKVFEVLADKTKIPPEGEQLSGVGFSSTLRNKVTVKAMGRDFSSNFNIAF